MLNRTFVKKKKQKVKFRVTVAAEICRAGFQRDWSCIAKELQKYA